jgi:hypothetical protein
VNQSDRSITSLKEHPVTFLTPKPTCANRYITLLFIEGQMGRGLSGGDRAMVLYYAAEPADEPYEQVRSYVTGSPL